MWDSNRALRISILLFFFIAVLLFRSRLTIFHGLECESKEQKYSGILNYFMLLIFFFFVTFLFFPDIFVTLEKQNLQKERDQLNISLKQLQTRNINLTEERDGLQTRFNILSKNYSQIENERSKLKAGEWLLNRSFYFFVNLTLVWLLYIFLFCFAFHISPARSVEVHVKSAMPLLTCESWLTQVPNPVTLYIRQLLKYFITHKPCTVS